MRSRSQKMMHHEWPNTLVIILGLVLTGLAQWNYALIYAGIVLFTILYMGARICTHCSGIGSETCPSLYGYIAGKLFKKAQNPNFEHAYKKNLPVVMLEWIFPVIVGLIYVILEFEIWLFIFLIAFILIGFVWLPLKSKKDCMECENHDCPHRKAMVNSTQ